MKSLKESRYEISQNISNLVDSYSPVLIHSDLIGALGLIENKSNSTEIITSHIKSIEEIMRDKPFYFPTFNYDFASSEFYDVKNDESQVGTLSEYYRKYISNWRSSIPIFNFCGKNAAPIDELNSKDAKIIDPFGAGSFFDYLYKSNGLVFFYGAKIDSFTGIHFIERLIGGPLYRYDKLFSGKVNLLSQQIVQTKLNYHVRPQGQSIQYDFDKLWQLICEAGFGFEFKMPLVNIRALNFNGTVKILSLKLKSDPFFMLTPENAVFWEKEYNRLGRGVRKQDYETS